VGLQVTTTTRALEQVALDLAERGYHVFPCKPGDKRPLTANGFKDATRDERKILQWWDKTPDANIGIACGASGICVLDIDSKSGADPNRVLEGREHGGTLILTGAAPAQDDQHPQSLPGVRGAQVYFRGTLATGPLPATGCEIRGPGAYVVAPGSIHPSGLRYTGQLPPVNRLPPPPRWVEILVESRRNGNGNGARRDEGGAIAAGGRNQALASEAGRLRRAGATENVLLAALRAINAERCQPPLDDDEVQQVAHSIARYEPAEAVQAARTALLTNADAKQARRALEELLTLDTAGIKITAARVYGKGSGAQVEIDLSNGETMTFGALRDMLRPQALIGEVGATAELHLTVKQPQCAEAMVLTKKLAQFVPTDSENDVAREWGRDFLELAETLDVDMGHQEERYRAFEMLKERNSWGDKRVDRDDTPDVGGPLVLRHLDGTLYVRTVWFERYVRSRDASVSRIAVSGRMARVGWQRRGKHGDIKATAKARKSVLIYPFWIVPADWLDRVEATA
jgi:hypothetical protein